MAQDMRQDIHKGVLIIGSGVGGLKAALEVAARGRQVYLVDRSPFFGGEIMRIERQFPTNRCCLCQMLPTTNRVEEGEYCLRRDFHHPLIELIPGAELVDFSGKEGNFQARIRQRARGVREEVCTGCRKCIDVCPEEVSDGFNCFGTHKAISLRGPQPVPPIPAIDWEDCTRCGRCVEVCPTDAIDLKMADAERELQVNSVILAPGFDEFDPSILTQYGYGRWKNVVTSIEWERMVSSLGSSSGPFSERIGRPSDGRAVKKVAFLLCVGSRERRWDFCSSACCMYAVKEALLAKELREDLEVAVFYMDLRGFGKGYDRYIEQAKEMGVRFVRGRTPRLWEDPQTQNPILSMFEDGKLIKEAYDLVVLAIGQRPPLGSAELAQTVGVDLNAWGFCKTTDPAGIATTRSGVFVCGSFSEPKDIPDTVTQATACALKALGRGREKIPSLVKAGDQTPDEEPKIGVVLCQCKGEVSEGLDLDLLKEAVRSRPAVSDVMEVDALCVQDSTKGLVREIRRQGINRLLVGACAPYWFRRRFLENVRGIDPWLIEWVDLREGVIHPHGEERGYKKAEDMVLMAIERLKRKDRVPLRFESVKGSVLVVGGGLAGLTAASALADKGVEVHLVEQGGELGGVLKGMPQQKELLQGYKEYIDQNPLVHVYRTSNVNSVRGQAGDFSVLIKGADGEHEVGIGAIVLATGSEEYLPKEFFYGENKRVITQRELQSGFASGAIKPQEMRSVVMIQCVGSRDSKHPWCNRYCCTEALENALVLKERNPDLEIYILFRDMMTYGFREGIYSRAREAGVIFFRYEEITDLKVQGVDRLKVVFQDMKINGDLLVLSTGVVPSRENKKLAKLFNLELTAEGFFKEAEPKFRPVDTLREGIYLCGGAHSPRSWQEVILQAEAAAERTLILVEQERLVTPEVVSQVVVRRCSGCGLCVEACPYGARIFDEERIVAVVKEALCQGCGVCSGLCPNGAAILQGYKEDQVLAMIEAVL